MDLQGKVAVVTGGASGLGAAIARAFAGAGSAVVVLDLDGERAGSVAGELGPGSFGMTVDVGDTRSVVGAAEAVAERFGRCDVVCANVGVQQFGAIELLTEREWSWVLDVNVLGVVRTVTAFLPLLRAATGWRRIVITSSSGALVPGVRLGAYTASKCAVMGFGETLRMELADEGIGVSVLFPAGMSTRHLETSAAAKPPAAGEWTVAPDDIEAMMASRSISDSHVATPEHAARNLLAELERDPPFIVTHGDFRDAFRARIADLEAAFDRMEQS